MDVSTSIESARLKLLSKNYRNIIFDNIQPDSLKALVDPLKTQFIPFEKYAAKNESRPAKKVYTQEIVSFWSVKGGVGKTSIVKEAALQMPEEIKTLIIDFNTADGGSDLSFMLNLPPVPHIGLYFKEETKESLLNNCIEIGKNKYILQAVPARKFISGIGEESINRLINYARAAFGLVMIDLPNEDNELVRSIIRYSTKVFMVTSGFDSELKRIKEKGIGCCMVFYNPKTKTWRRAAKQLNLRWILISNLKREAVNIINEIYS